MIDTVAAALRTSQRPLLVCDVDEVVLEFLDPFDAYLQSVSHRLHPDSFKLQGNIRSIEGVVATSEMVSFFLEEFFRTQDLWQKPACDAFTTLKSLESEVDIVFLTAMPPRHQNIRRNVLNTFGFDYPLIATEEPKGPVVASLLRGRSVKSAFIDDIARNLLSVGESVPDCLLVNLMANETFRKMAPPPAGGAVSTAQSWLEAGEFLRRHFEC